MSVASTQKLLVVLLVAASLGVTVLVTMTVLASGRAAGGPGAVMQVHGFSGGDANGPLPVLVTLPEFSLVERSGQKLGLDDLRGKVWIASFIFTRCMGPCPAITARMEGLQKRLAGTPGWDRTRLVSFSVDPEHDSPEILRAYAKGFNADPQHWLMLTGDKKVVWPLVRTGFKLAVGDSAPDAAMPIMHSTKFVLVDAQGRVRGYYDGLEGEACDRLAADAGRLLEEPAPRGRP